MKLRDDQWKKLAPLLIGKQGDPGAKAKNNRLYIEAVLWIVLNQASWSSLPAQFGKINAVYMRFRRWNMCDVWRQLAQSQIDDPDLQCMLESIVQYGDQYTRRIERRLNRKAKKKQYMATINTAKGIQSVMREIALAGPSTLHWVGLVTP